MADDLTALKSSVSDRATALGAYIKALKADSARSDPGFSRALDVCAGYTRAFVEQLRKDWDETPTREGRQELLESSLVSFLEREGWIDQRFARGAQSDVPRALKTIARKEFRKHGLDGHEPVLTVGPPDSFETHQASLAKFLFADVHISFAGDLADIEHLRYGGSDLSIFSAPYIEGTRVLWYPIVLGHEIAHVRLDRANGWRSRDSMVETWLTDRGIDYSMALDSAVAESEDPDLARVVLDQQLVSWVTELICDLNAVRLFGPAGFSAIAEFLAILEFELEPRVFDTKSHPPLWVRLTLLLEALNQWGWQEATNLPAYAAVWAPRASRPSELLDSRTLYLANIVTRRNVMQQLIGLVREWGDGYEAGQSEAAIEYVAGELLDGVPGGTHVPQSTAEWPPVSVPDVVNGAWAARRVLDDQEAGEAVAHTGALLECDLNPHDKRIRLDSLASKAIDTLELARLWGGRKGIVALNRVDIRRPLQAPQDKPDDITRSNDYDGTRDGGVLSRRTIARRLRAARASIGRRLVVTPLSADSVQDAAIDLRLGPDFIVFRHSGISAFNPLAEDGQDPRTMQERVHKGWGERFILHPQELVLAATLEYIVLPDDVAAQVLTRSSYGRLGLLTATAVQVQPGSRGCITLELVNQSETPIELAPGARVAQLMLWTVNDPCVVERGKYWFPVGPEFSKVGEDPDSGPLQSLAAAAKEPATAPRPRLRLRFEGEREVAEQFYRVARSLGAEDAPASGGRPESRRLGPPEVAALITAIVLSIRVLATTLQRWLQGTGHGVVVREVDGDVIVRVDRRLPRGTIVIVDREGVTFKQLEMPPDDIDDVTQAIRGLLGGG